MRAAIISDWSTPKRWAAISTKTLGNDRFTWEWWIRARKLNYYGNEFSTFTFTGYYPAGEINSGYLRLYPNNVISSKSINWGTWTHCGIVVDYPVIKFYIDGTLIGTQTASWSVGSSVIQFNYYASSQRTRILSGLWGPFSIWSRPLNDQEIYQCYQGQLPSNLTGLWGYYPLTEGTGNVLVDHSGNNNNFTLNYGTKIIWRIDRNPIVKQASEFPSGAVVEWHVDWGKVEPSGQGAFITVGSNNKMYIPCGSTARGYQGYFYPSGGFQTEGHQTSWSHAYIPIGSQAFDWSNGATFYLRWKTTRPQYKRALIEIGTSYKLGVMVNFLSGYPTNEIALVFNGLTSGYNVGKLSSGNVVARWFRGTKLEYWLNGTLVYTYNSTTIPSLDDNIPYLSVWGMPVLDFAVWNRPLTDSEIQTLANWRGYKQHYEVPTPDLPLYWFEASDLVSSSLTSKGVNKTATFTFGSTITKRSYGLIKAMLWYTDNSSIVPYFTGTFNGSNCTICAWSYPTISNSTPGNIYMGNTSGTLKLMAGKAWPSSSYGKAAPWRYVVFSGTYNSFTQSYISLEEPMFHCIVLQGSTVNYYINGILLNSFSGFPAWGGTSFNLYSNNQNLNAEPLISLRFYDKVLTPDQMKQIMLWDMNRGIINRGSTLDY